VEEHWNCVAWTPTTSQRETPRLRQQLPRRLQRQQHQKLESLYLREAPQLVVHEQFPVQHPPVERADLEISQRGLTMYKQGRQVPLCHVAAVLMKQPVADFHVVEMFETLQMGSATPSTTIAPVAGMVVTAVVTVPVPISMIHVEARKLCAVRTRTTVLSVCQLPPDPVDQMQLRRVPVDQM